jgi:hypothetical protein
LGCSAEFKKDIGLKQVEAPLPAQRVLDKRGFSGLTGPEKKMGFFGKHAGKIQLSADIHGESLNICRSCRQIS